MGEGEGTSWVLDGERSRTVKVLGWLKVLDSERGLMVTGLGSKKMMSQG